MTIRAHVLDTAKSHVLKDRNTDYDIPERNFETIAELFNTYWNATGREHTITMLPHDVAVFMTLVKIARIATSPKKEDHWIDLAGYAACGAECICPPPAPDPDDDIPF